MSSDGIRFLLDCKGECEWLDYKSFLNITSDKELADFAKDVLAIKNTGGGFIVVGVTDKTWNPIGLSMALPYDGKMLRDKIRKASGVELEVDIVSHEIFVSGSTRRFALILVRSTKKRKKRRTPTVVKADFCPGKPFGLRRGDIYVRKGDSTVKIDCEDELSELLDNLEAQADDDALTASGRRSPFAIEDGLYRLLEKGFEQFIGRTQLRKELDDAIIRDPRIWIINVHGPGGVGKTALVNYCVYEYYKRRVFEAIIQLTAKETVLTSRGIEQFSRSLYSLENLLDHILINFGEKLPDSLEEKRKVAIECLSTWKVLLVLDNMETVQDGRILSFVQGLPPETKAKILLTSRSKTGGWELPVPVSEMTEEEVGEFIRIRREELGLNFPTDGPSIRKVWEITGGLPLAVQWVMGRYRLIGNFDKVTSAVTDKDSPVLEFSFRNIWQMLSADARTILAISTIFNNPPTAQQYSIALNYAVDRIERALVELTDTTLMTRSTNSSDGRVTYITLPITLAFARIQLGEMGNLEVEARQRFQRFTNQMDLHQRELAKFQSRFDKYGLDADYERRAAILCQRGESEMFFGNTDNADMLFKQARDLAPRCSYILAMNASYELARNRVGNAIVFVNQACDRATKQTGALCYTIKARILQVQRDYSGRVSALNKAISFAPDDHVLRHQYGVALSINDRPEEAIAQFTYIIEHEKGYDPPGLQLLMALKTRMINYRRLGRDNEVRADLKMANDVLSRYPHLAGEAHHFREFVDAYLV